MPENTGQKQENGRFQKGVSVNPSGMPKGTRHRSTLLAERLLVDEIHDICASVIAEAKKGNIQAAKIILDRVLPSRRDRVIDVQLPKLQTVDDAVKAMSTIINAIGSGDITPSEGEAMSRAVDTFIKAIQVHDIEKRVSMLEQGVKK